VLCLISFENITESDFDNAGFPTKIGKVIVKHDYTKYGVSIQFTQ